MTLSDTDLDARLIAAGALLDDLADERSTSRTRGRGDRRAHPVLLAAAVVALLVALAGAAVVAARPEDGGSVASGPPGPGSVRMGFDATPAGIRSVGAAGLVVTPDALVDLATGESTPLEPTTHPIGPTTDPVPDGNGGIYYLAHVADADPDDPDDAGRVDLRHLLPDGNDDVVRTGVHSFALRADGALAVALEEEPIIRPTGEPLLRTIDVIAPDGTTTAWTTTPLDDEIIAWAGDRLLVAFAARGSQLADVTVLDGPEDRRMLGSAARVNAVGPDGSWVVMSRGASSNMAGSDEPRPLLVVDVATGQERGTVTVDPAAAVVETLTWDGDTRLVGGAATTGQDPLLVELAVDVAADGTVAIRTTRTTALDPGLWVPGAVWAGADGTLVALGRNRENRRLRLLVCPDGDACRVHAPPFRDITPVTDRSRPSGG